MPDDNTLRKELLNGRKSERIIFAVTPEMKEAIAKMAIENCMSVSAYITDVIARDLVANKDVVRS